MLNLNALFFAWPGAVNAPLQATGEVRLAWWLALLIVIVTWLIIMLLFGGRRPEDTAVLAAKVEIPVEPQEKVSLTGLAAQQDDLKLIEGVGPKISNILAKEGIRTFAQLADSDVDHLTKIVRDAGITIANPATWPEQARFAANQDWDGLKELQGQLKGGRRAT